MCGIAGGLFWGAAVPRERAARAVEAMVPALAHRGPDGRGRWEWPQERDARGPFVVLGHTRLAILDLSDTGAQPMTGGATASCISYNGETYNFRELIRELQAGGFRPRGSSDTEVLLAAYHAWDWRFVTRLRGMFALALWDPRQRRLLLARDRLGIKPLYYYEGDGFVLFASEVRALLATGLVPRRLDPVSLWHYLGYQSIPAPRTLVHGVRMLEPACCMTVDERGATAQAPYWNMLAAAADPADVPAEAARERVSGLLRESIALHMVSDVPVGAFLSGGIDSSAIVALMREGGWTPRTFSVGFAEASYDESAHARSVAARFGAEHVDIQLSEADLLASLQPAIAAMDQPTGDGINTYVISQAVRATGLKVALSGLGGDELFGGYPSFARLQRAAELGRAWGRWPASVRSTAAAAVRTIGRSSVAASKAAAVLETDGSLAAMFPVTRRVLSNEQRMSMLSPEVADAVAGTADPYDQLLAGAFARTPDAGLFARVSFGEARTYMHDVLLRDTDQMSMAHALEVRVPLLDHVLVETVIGLPDEYKQPQATLKTPKRLLVEALGLLPDDIVQRPKQGFTLPFEVWMRGALRPFCDGHLGARGLSTRGLFRGEEVSRLWESFLNGGRDVTWSRVWVLVVLDAWLELHELTVDV